MSRRAPIPVNPLETGARKVPLQIADRGLLGAKVLGVLALTTLSINQSYDGTRAFTLLVAVLVTASFAPLRGVIRVVAVAAGAGLLFFAGSALTFYGVGLFALACGLAASLAALVVAAHRGTTPWTLAGLFAGAPITAAVAVLVIAATER